MTTRAPPVILSNVTLVESFTLYPQISRDTNVASVDLGYHYDPIDFLVNNVPFVANQRRRTRSRSTSRAWWRRMAAWGSIFRTTLNF